MTTGGARGGRRGGGGRGARSRATRSGRWTRHGAACPWSRRPRARHSRVMRCANPPHSSLPRCASATCHVCTPLTLRLCRWVPGVQLEGRRSSRRHRRDKAPAWLCGEPWVRVADFSAHCATSGVPRPPCLWDRTSRRHLCRTQGRTASSRSGWAHRHPGCGQRRPTARSAARRSLHFSGTQLKAW